MSLENYEPVAVRLGRLLENLRADNKDPRIVTVMLSTPGADTCVFRAELWLGDALVATGHAEEVRGQGNVNRTSHVENCETSAVGRMCENYSPNPDWQKRPSREEMSKVQHPSNGGPRPATTSGDAASPAQLGKIRAMSKSLGKTPPIGYESFTKREASAAIDKLMGEQQAQDGATVQHQFRDAQEEPF